MIYRFTIISDEVDDFVREIQIDPEATFYDFHEAILKSVGYTNDQMTSFFICDDDWEKEKEITLEEMDDNPEMDSWVMKETPISELVEDEKQKLLYVFDYMTCLLYTSLEIRGGTGGDEAAIFAGDLFRMYTKYCETKGWKMEISSANEGAAGGFKEIICSVTCLLYTSRCV